MNNDQILEKLGVLNADDSAKEAILISITTVVEERVSGLVQEIMTRKQLAHFTEMVKTQTPEAVHDWISEEVVDTKQLYEAALADYIEEKSSQTNGQIS